MKIDRMCLVVLSLGLVSLQAGCPPKGVDFKAPSDMFVNPEAGPSSYVGRDDSGNLNVADAFTIITRLPSSDVASNGIQIQKSDEKDGNKPKLPKKVGLRPLLYRAHAKGSGVEESLSTSLLPGVYYPQINAGISQNEKQTTGNSTEDGGSYDILQARPWLIYTVWPGERLNFKSLINLAASYDVSGGYAILTGKSSGSASYRADVNMTNSDPYFRIRFIVNISELYKTHVSTLESDACVVLFYSGIGAPSSASVFQSAKTNNSGGAGAMASVTADVESSAGADYSSRLVLCRYANPAIVKGLVRAVKASIYPPEDGWTAPDNVSTAAPKQTKPIRMFEKVTLSEAIAAKPDTFIVFEDDSLFDNSSEFRNEFRTHSSGNTLFVPRSSTAGLTQKDFRDGDSKPLTRASLNQMLVAKCDRVAKIGKVDAYRITEYYARHLQAEQVALFTYPEYKAPSTSLVITIPIKEPPLVIGNSVQSVKLLEIMKQSPDSFKNPVWNKTTKMLEFGDTNNRTKVQVTPDATGSLKEIEDAVKAMEHK